MCLDLCLVFNFDLEILYINFFPSLPGLYKPLSLLLFSLFLSCPHYFQLIFTFKVYLSLNCFSLPFCIFRCGGHCPGLLCVSPSHSFLRSDKLCSDHQPCSTFCFSGPSTGESSGGWLQLTYLPAFYTLSCSLVKPLKTLYSTDKTIYT